MAAQVVLQACCHTPPSIVDRQIGSEKDHCRPQMETPRDTEFQGVSGPGP